MKNMKAFVAVSRGNYRIQDVPIPEIGDDDILIQMKTAAICGSDVHVYKGEMDPLCGYPVIMGHENAGIIVKKGKNVHPRWQVGDRVVSENTIEVCGTCYACATGDYVACEHRKGMGIGADGCFAEYVKIPGELLKRMPDCIFHIPDNVGDEEAPLIEPAANAYKVVFQEGKLMAGEMVLVTGAGAIGVLCAHMAAVGGAARVILMVRHSTSPNQIEIARQLGVTDVVYSDAPKAALEVIQKITDGQGVDLAVETTSSPDVLHQCTQLVRVKGRIVRIAIGGSPYSYGLDEITLRSLVLIGHMGYDTVSWRNTIRLAKEGKLNLKAIITHRIPFMETKKGFDMMVNRKAGKIILEF